MMRNTRRATTVGKSVAKSAPILSLVDAAKAKQQRQLDAPYRFLDDRQAKSST